VDEIRIGKHGDAINAHAKQYADGGSVPEPKSA
jgi:hypothetical protein